MEVKLTWKHVIVVWWALTWRNIAALVCALILVMALSAVFALATVMLGIPKEIAKPLVVVIGGVLGIAATIIPLKFIFNKNYKGFRISIVEDR